jgi:hypothetical protein
MATASDSPPIDCAPWLGRQKYERVRRLTSRFNVPHYIQSAIAPNIQSCNEVGAGRIGLCDFHLQSVAGGRRCIRAPKLLRGRLRNFERPTADSRKRRAEGNARREGAFSTEPDHTYSARRHDLLLQNVELRDKIVRPSVRRRDAPRPAVEVRRPIQLIVRRWRERFLRPVVYPEGHVGFS